MYEDNFPYNSYSEQRVTNEPEMTPNKNPKKEKFSYGKKAMVVISLGLFFGICGGLGFQAVTSASDFIKAGMERAEDKIELEEAVEAIGEAQAGAEQTSKSVQAAGLVDYAANTSAVVTDVTEVVRAVMPSVVSVSNNYVETMRFYDREFSSEGVSSGSGIIVGENDTELLIATNYHVVLESQKLEIQFVDGSTAEANIKGYESSMDIAVVAVKLEDISADTRGSIAIANLGDSESLAVGEPAIAIGNSLGYGQSVTCGVVSALNREAAYSNGESEVNGEFIQTDAAINPGNSGGALLNVRGEVIGINSNKISGSLVEGMGYAIPISSVKPILSELMLQQTREKVDQEEQGYLGITGITVGDEYSEVYNLPKGVYISQVFEGTAAEAAGLVKGDIVTRFDGTEITTMEALQKRMSYYLAGETVDITIMRGDAMGGYQQMTLTVELGSRGTLDLE